MSRSLTALVHTGPLDDGVTSQLDAPRVGVFRAAVSMGDAVQAGRRLGWLTVLGRTINVAAPAGAAGRVQWTTSTGPVAYGDPLVQLGVLTAADPAGSESATAAASNDGYAVRAPIGGIFYSRPSPDTPQYVTVGAEVAAGQTLGLIEVMKTFNPVTLGGPGAPERARVVSIEAPDNAEVAAGDVLVRVEPL